MQKDKTHQTHYSTSGLLLLVNVLKTVELHINYHEQLYIRNYINLIPERWKCFYYINF